MQDKTDHSFKIKGYIRAAHGFRDETLESMIVYEKNCDQFLVPNELYAESRYG